MMNRRRLDLRPYRPIQKLSLDGVYEEIFAGSSNVRGLINRWDDFYTSLCAHQNHVDLLRACLMKNSCFESIAIVLDELIGRSYWRKRLVGEATKDIYKIPIDEIKAAEYPLRYALNAAKSLIDGGDNGTELLAFVSDLNPHIGEIVMTATIVSCGRYLINCDGFDKYVAGMRYNNCRRLINKC